MSQLDSKAWLQAAEGLVRHREEALSFVNRVSTQFPQAQTAHASAVAHLWQKAEEVDQKIGSLLNDMNQELLRSQGQQDTTRGANIGSGAGEMGSFCYTCSWILEWGEGLGIRIELGVVPFQTLMALRVVGSRSEEIVHVPYPLTSLEDLQNALVMTYAAEETAEAPTDRNQTASSRSTPEQQSDFLDHLAQLRKNHGDLSSRPDL